MHMELSVFVEIEKPLEDVWHAIIDFKNHQPFFGTITVENGYYQTSADRVRFTLPLKV